MAGLRAAIEAIESGNSTAVISKVHPLRSHSVAAQGGINAALGNAPGAEDDSWEDHAFDTVKGSDYLADQDTVDVLCREAPRAVIELEHMGAVFSRFDDGKIAQRPFGGANFPRTCYAADRTGRNLLHTLYEQLTDMDVTFFEEYYVTSLVRDEERITGCIALNIADGSLHGFTSKATLLASGGYGRLFARSTNAPINTGDGAALAFRAGVPLMDMEFVQFHPTTLYGSNILITEGARGEGGYLFNNKHERFMKEYAPKAMELSPRDIVARAIQKEVDEGRGFEDQFVHLDLTHLGAEKINERLPGIRSIAMDFAGVDPIGSPIPVQPGQHYSMGGVASSIDCSTPISGLYAAGECACISVHGANRLGGNSLLETVVFGRIAGETMVKAVNNIPVPSKNPVISALQDEQARIDSILNRDKGEKMASIKEDLKNVMFDHFGVFREENKMRAGLDQLEKLNERAKKVFINDKGRIFNQSLIYTLELQGMLLISNAVAQGSLNRRESRGSHFRTDYPVRDDEQFLKHTLAYYRDNETVIEYSDVTLGRYPVKERVY